MRDFVALAFAVVDLDWRDFVEIDERYFRPAEVDYLLADASKARRLLGWEPEVRFPELVRLMVESDLGETDLKISGGTELLRMAVER